MGMYSRGKGAFPGLKSRLAGRMLTLWAARVVVDGVEQCPGISIRHIDQKRSKFLSSLCHLGFHHYHLTVNHHQQDACP